jgi:hypothetical protein
MAEAIQLSGLADRLHEQNMSQLAQVGVVVQQNFATVSKATDYDYLHHKNLVSLSEAVGVREVASRVTPAGPVPADPTPSTTK